MLPKFPWTNFHRLNADWILETVQTAVDNVNRAVERIEAALTTVDGLTERVTALETSTQQLQASVEALDERVSGLNRRITTLDETITGVDERVSGLNRRITTLDESKADKPIIINLISDGTFPAQIPETMQAQVQAALSALQTGTGAAQVRIEQQDDQALPAVFNARLSYAGDSIITGALSRAFFNATTQDYAVRITTISINTAEMSWEMVGRDMVPGPIKLTATPSSQTTGHWTGATWAALVAHARAGGIINVNISGMSLSFTAAVSPADEYIETPVISLGGYIRMLENGSYALQT